MKEIIDPIKTILVHYCHAECYEVHELLEDMSKPSWKLDVGVFKQQLEEMIQQPNEYVASVNDLTANEFEDEVELKEWLENIWGQTFE